MPYPSDHRGVVPTFQVVPGPSPYLVAVHQPAVFAGDEIVVRYHAPGDERDRISLVLAGGDTASESLMSLPPRESVQDGVVIFGTSTLDPALYEEVLTAADGSELARIPFLVQSPEARPTITPAEPDSAVGESISIAWENAPGNKWDWIGICAADDADLETYLAFLYTNAEMTGPVVCGEQAFGDPLPPGDYEARLMRDDGYLVLASAPFAVVDETG